MSKMIRTAHMNPLKIVKHRPWPLPQGPWLMVQFWYDLLFAHWPVPAESMRRMVPCELPLDAFDGACWVSMTPFHMSNRVRMLPAFPFTARFRELNCRTYVNLGGKPGVFFFSLDASSYSAVWGAQTFYHLPYKLADMQARKESDSIVYSSRRASAEFTATYRPVAQVTLAAPGTLDHWLTERYCLYTVHRGHVFRGDIHHVPWPLQEASAEIGVNTIAEAAGIQLPGVRPLLAFCRELEVLIWPLRRTQ